MEVPLVVGPAETPLLRAGSAAAQASARLTHCVRRLRMASCFAFFLPHGIIGLFWSWLWLRRPGSDGDYFVRMGVLQNWVFRANGLRYNLRLAAILGAVTASAGLVYLPFFLGASINRSDPPVGSILEVTIPLVYIILTSAAHAAHVLMRVLPAIAAFRAAATPALEAKLLSSDEASRFRAASSTAARVAEQLGIERFMGMSSALMTGQAIETVSCLGPRTQLCHRLPGHTTLLACWPRRAPCPGGER